MRRQNPNNMKLSAMRCRESDVSVADCPDGFKNLDTDTSTFFKQDVDFGGSFFCYNDSPFTKNSRYQGRCYRSDYPADSKSILNCCTGVLPETDCDPAFCQGSAACNAFFDSRHSTNPIDSQQLTPYVDPGMTTEQMNYGESYKTPYINSEQKNLYEKQLKPIYDNQITFDCLPLYSPLRKQDPNNMKLSAIKCNPNQVTVNDCPPEFKNLDPDVNTFIVQNNSGGPCPGDSFMGNTNRYQGKCYRSEYPTDRESIIACCKGQKAQTQCDPAFCYGSPNCKQYLDAQQPNILPQYTNPMNSLTSQIEAFGTTNPSSQKNNDYNWLYILVIIVIICIICSSIVACISN